MNFEDTLKKMIQDCPGVVGIALMGSDGIPISQAHVASAPADEADEEVTSAGVEFGRLLDEMRKSSDAIGGGRLEESFVGLDHAWLLFRVVDSEFFLISVLRPQGNLGKARYLMRRHLSELQALL
jgi:predicted regulator of Ras-like GTPase activity (Roadblock/LC7/MglB family)